MQVQVAPKGGLAIGSTGKFPGGPLAQCGPVQPEEKKKTLGAVGVVFNMITNVYGFSGSPANHLWPT